GLLGHRREGVRVAHSKLRQHLAIELDPGGVQPRDELVVRQPVRARSRVDANDPERAERPLLVLPIAVGVDERVLDLLLRVAVARLLEPPVALRLLEDLAALLARVDGALDAGHGLFHPQKLLDGLRIDAGDRLILPEATPPLRRLLLPAVALHRVPAQELACSGHPEALL